MERIGGHNATYRDDRDLVSRRPFLVVTDDPLDVFRKLSPVAVGSARGP
jgi:hypothetical protein